MTRPYRMHQYRPPEDDGGSPSSFWKILGAGLAFWMWRRWRRARTDESVDEEGIERGHRPEDDTNVRAVAAVGGGLLLFLALVFGLVALLMSMLDDGGRGDGAAEQTERQATPAGPRLQADPSIDLRAVRNREDSLLSSYGWASRPEGAVRIPIERAMELFARRPESESTPDTILLLTESGYVRLVAGAPPEPAAAPYLGTSPEAFTVRPEYADILGLIRVDEPEETLEGRSTIDQ